MPMKFKTAASVVLPLAISFYVTVKLWPAPFIRGDFDQKNCLDITDSIQIFTYLFLGDPDSSSCLDAGDANDDGFVDLTDGISLLEYLFIGGDPPASPFPQCGNDPTADLLNCEVFLACQELFLQVSGRTVSASGEPLSGVKVFSGGKTALTDMEGRFTIHEVEILPGNLFVSVVARLDFFIGYKSGIAPNFEGITVAGDIVLKPLDVPNYPGRVIPTKSGLWHTSAADLNGDANTDLVFSYIKEVGVLLGAGSGVFKKEENFPCGDTPFALEVIDLNKDGHADIVTANYFSGDLSFLFGKGDGSFQDQVKFSMPPFPILVASADLNEDGAIDLITSWNDASVLRLLYNDGAGSLVTEDVLAVGKQPTKVVVDDFNNDNKPDLACVNQLSNDVSILMKEGNNQFRPEIRFASGKQPISLVSGRFDADDFPDLAVATYGSGQVLIFKGNGDGTFNLKTSIGSFYHAGTLGTADLNGDGLEDLLYENTLSLDPQISPPHEAHNLSIAFSLGDGTFKVQQKIRGPGGFGGYLLVDLNKDEKLDLLESGLGFSLFWGQQDGTFSSPSRVPADILLTSVAAADLNQDHLLDFIVTKPVQDKIIILASDGAGGYQKNAMSIRPNFSPYDAAVADFNGDGLIDFVTANQGSKNASIYLGKGDGTFQNPKDLPAGQYPQSVVVGDLNDDGNADVVIINVGTNDISIYLGKGQAQFRDEIRLAPGGRPTSAKLADVNGDGNIDITVRNNDSSLSIFLGSGRGTFQHRLFNDIANRFSDFALADVNLDGAMDLVAGVPVYPDPFISVYLGDDCSTFKFLRNYPSGRGGSKIIAALLNEDDIPDLVLGGDVITVFLGLGDGSFTEPTHMPAGEKTAAVMVADVNGDGKPEIVTANELSGDLAIFYRQN
ncbi:MAG: VCBS repeat-containing protein [Planctomycetes bacterium]|nr:VCBS repeat-containing protein [Planctomycetota bacterium]